MDLGQMGDQTGTETTLTPLQAALLAVLRALAAEAGATTVGYRTEWAGWLVDPVACWLEVEGMERVDVAHRLPRGWQGADVAALAQAGALRQVGDWRNPEDEYDRRVTYKV